MGYLDELTLYELHKLIVIYHDITSGFGDDILRETSSDMKTIVRLEINRKQSNILLPGNTGELTPEQCKAITQLMSKGHSMRKAKRMLGITVKKPVKAQFKGV